MADATALDRDDPLAGYRDAFWLPEGIIYLNGNSLGAMPMASLAGVESAAGLEWAGHLIDGWTQDGWWDLPEELGELVAPIIGAAPGQTVVTDGTTVNLYKALWAALDARPGRTVIVAEAGGFPADLYITESIRAGREGLTLRLIEPGEPLEAGLDDDVAAVLLSHVDYRSGALIDMAAATRAAQAAGALTIWDLCHSVGVVPMALDDWNVDLAVGCTYKFLNDGPGAPAFIYVARRHHGVFRQPLSSWWGHAAPFAFEPQFRASDGIKAFLCGTQPVLSMRALKPALEIYESLDIADVRRKSMALTGLFIDEVERRCAGSGLDLISPCRADLRGSQVSFTHPEGFAIIQALAARGVIAGFRAPDVLRFGMAPLYLSHRDMIAAAEAVGAVLESEEWRDERFRQAAAVS